MPRIRLPPGFKFQPTDQELVSVYLLPKFRGENLADDFIKVSEDVYKKPPSEFCTDSTALYGHDNIGKHYFFTKLDRPSQKVVRTVGSCGLWHESKKQNIDYKVNNKTVTIGCKRLLNFKLKGEGECKTTKTTNWLMHEFSLSSEKTNLVLCVIQNKKKDEEKGSGSPLVLGLGWGSDSGSGRRLTITSAESGSPRSFFDNPDMFDRVYAFPPSDEETAEAERRPGELDALAEDPVTQFDPMSLLLEEQCPAQYGEIQPCMNMGPQCDNDLLSGCSDFIPSTLLNEDAPILSPEFYQYFN